MKRVVIIAPSFAPSSYPPTHRVRFFARHLPDFGWEPEVLTVDPRFSEEPADAEIDRLIPASLPVVRTPAFSPRWTRRFGVGDLGMRAYFPMRRVLRRLCATRRPDLLFIPGPPWHTFLLGADMREEFGVPYVLDYIDPWVNALGDDGRWWTKAYWFRRMAIALEPRAVRHASHIVAVSDGTNDGVRERYPGMALPPSMFTGIPYGFEASDFDSLRANPRPNPYWRRDDGLLHFVYVGAMLPKGFGTLRAILQAVRSLRDTAPELYARLRLHFFGTTYDPRPTEGLVVPVAREMGVAHLVDEHPARIPYLDALNVLCSADGILGMGSTERHYTASKIFPCILARRPLLAVYHEASSVCDIVRAANAGELVTYSDEAPAETRSGAIAEALQRLVAPGGYDPARVRWDHFEAFSARNMTRQLAGAFDRVVGSAAAAGPAREPVTSAA